MRNSLLWRLITFAYNVKRFAIAILFFLVLIPNAVFGRIVLSFLVNILRLVSLKACDQELTDLLDTQKIFL